jgi:D-sedoheptulose 7-phosphate isomerase
MAMLEQRIQQQFFESADLQYQAAEVLSRPIADAVQAMVAGLTAGARVLAAGLGQSAGLAQLFTADLVGRFERERPGLAALTLGGDGIALSAIAADGGFDRVLVRQVEALGHPGDVLLLLESANAHPALAAAARAAQAKEITVVALTGPDGSALRSVLGETDVHIAVPHERGARVLETQLLVLHALCDGIDFQLLGEQDPV